MDDAKNTTGQAKLLTGFSKDLNIYIANRGEEKDNQGEEVRTKKEKIQRMITEDKAHMEERKREISGLTKQRKQS